MKRRLTKENFENWFLGNEHAHIKFRPHLITILIEEKRSAFLYTEEKIYFKVGNFITSRLKNGKIFNITD